jgi:hypothetical protein
MNSDADPEIQVVQHDYVALDPPRDLRPDERGALEILFSQNFPGNVELRRQLDISVATAECRHCGSIFIQIDKVKCSPAQLLAPMPISAYTNAADGMFVEVLALVKDGYLDELRIWRGDGQSILEYPDISKAVLVAPDQP